eukprot:scaffold3456_cov78-Skeletonema_dohrnii-CCMP3373.AAC.6
MSHHADLLWSGAYSSRFKPIFFTLTHFHFADLRPSSSKLLATISQQPCQRQQQPHPPSKVSSIHETEKRTIHQLHALPPPSIIITMPGTKSILLASRVKHQQLQGGIEHCISQLKNASQKWMHENGNGTKSWTADVNTQTRRVLQECIKFMY